MLKHWRLLIVLIAVLGSVLAIGLKEYPYGRQGVEVIFVTPDSPARGLIGQGDIITKLNGEQILGKQDWDNKIQGLTGTITLTSNGQNFEFTINNSLGIDASDIERTNLEFGLDLKGGTRILLSPKENVSIDLIDQIISTLETRANVYGLQEIKFQPIITGDTFLIQVDTAGLQKNLIEDLITTQGKFEAKLIKPVDISENTVMILGQDLIPIQITDDGLIINDNLISINDSININGIDFEYVNKTETNLFLLASVYDGQDIEFIPSDPQSTSVFPQGSGYGFFFTVVVSIDGAQRFADVTTGIPSILDFQSGERYLNSQILLFLDDQLVTRLSISESLAGDVFTAPQITGFRETQEEAFSESLRLQTILRSGALPTTLETVSINTISPTLGTEFFTTSIYAGLLAGLIVFIIVFIRYRSFKVAIPLILISFAEIIIILGIASTNDISIWGSVLVINILLISVVWWKKHEMDIFAWVGAILIPLLGMISWTIDLPAIGGIIAAIGTGIDHQIIIADEALKNKLNINEDVKKKIKTAMFIIFGAAATIIAAMLPLVFLGVGVVRGFAITTIVGVFVGFLITRPAYAKIVESISRKKQKDLESQVQ